MLKKGINIGLLLVMLITVIPIKQVGKMLYTNQWTEEIADHSCGSSEQKSHLFGNWQLIVPHYAEAGWWFCREVQQIFHQLHQKIPVNPSGEVYIHPPDAA